MTTCTLATYLNVHSFMAIITQFGLHRQVEGLTHWHELHSVVSWISPFL